MVSLEEIQQMWKVGLQLLFQFFFFFLLVRSLLLKQSEGFKAILSSLSFSFYLCFS